MKNVGTGDPAAQRAVVPEVVQSEIRCCPLQFSNRNGQGLIFLRFILRAGL
jgi:hypothetical protein